MPQTIYDLTFCLVSKYQVVSGIAASTKIQIKAEIHHHQKIQQPKLIMEIRLDITLCTKLQYHFAYEGKCIHTPFFFRLSLLLEKDSRRALVNFSHKEVVKRRKFSHFVVNAEKKFNL